MSINKNNSITSKLTAIDVKHKLSALWLVFMLLYVYTDFYSLYLPGKLQEMMSGAMDGVIVTQVSLLICAMIAIIPAFMIFLSLVVNDKVNRWLNIILGILHIGIGIANLIGATWTFYIFYGISLMLVASLIVVYAWKWRKPVEQI